MELPQLLFGRPWCLQQSALPTSATILHPGKGKVKLSLCLTKHHAMKTYCGVEV
jgi:hypothetical protein